MLREINDLKKLAKVAFDRKMRCGLMLCAVLWLTSGSVPALIHQQPMSGERVLMPVVTEVSVAVSSTGCTPSSATQSAGQITLKVVNETGEAELAVQLYGSKGELIREVNIRQGATQWSETFDLVAGNYTLIAGHNPEWIFHLTMQ